MNGAWIDGCRRWADSGLARGAGSGAPVGSWGPATYDGADEPTLTRPSSGPTARAFWKAFPMIAKPPPREGSMGFLLLPPYRVQGTSVAGESTCVQIPELDICFDMGQCPRM